MGIQMVKYNEPREKENATIEITKEEAIKNQRKYIMDKLGRDPYVSDDEALWDFKMMHGAWEE